jgi:hypothetical protein
MSHKITRRQLAGVAAGSTAVSLAVVKAIGQAQDWDRSARESHLQNSAALAKFDISISVEPAFQFKA